MTISKCFNVMGSEEIASAGGLVNVWVKRATL